MKSENPTLSTEIHRIKSIVKGEDGWYLYTDYEHTPLFVDKKYYQGSAFAWYNRLRFWHKPTLEICRVKPCNFIIWAILDGKKLFEVEKDDSPEYVQTNIARGEEIRLKNKARQKPVFEALASYARKLPLEHDLGYKLSQLHVAMRTYLRLHLFKGERTEEAVCRLNLMFRLCVVAEEILCNRIGGLDSISIRNGFDKVPEPFDMKWLQTEEKFLKDLELDSAGQYQYYDYINRKLRTTFPGISDLLILRYLNHLVQQVVFLYYQDRKRIENQRKKNFEEVLRGYSDEYYYRNGQLDMKLLRFTNALLPKAFTDEEIRGFI